MRTSTSLALILFLLLLISVGVAADPAAPLKRTTTPAETVENIAARPIPTPAVGPAGVPAKLGADASSEETSAPAANDAAAAYSLDWYSVNGGGAVNASSTNYRMGLSVGQSVSGSGSSTNYSLGIGFWYGVGTDSVACPIVVAGDVNADGVANAADVITQVNWIFKSIPGPAPCDAAGDVNCDGFPNAADIITEVNYVFKSTPLPCHACDSPLASAC